MIRVLLKALEISTVEGILDRRVDMFKVHPSIHRVDFHILYNLLKFTLHVMYKIKKYESMLR